MRGSGGGDWRLGGWLEEMWERGGLRLELLDGMTEVSFFHYYFASLGECFRGY